MIIGIDESGDFSDGSRSYFVGVLVRPSVFDHVADAQRQWERRTRARLGLANEVKGARVDGQALEEFATRVMTAGGDDGVAIMAFAVDVDAPNLRAMDVQRDTWAAGYESWAKTQEVSDERERQKFARQLRHWATWVKARSGRDMLRLATLGSILPTLLENAFGFSIARGFDVELVDLKFCIDSGYVKGSELGIWRDMVRNVFVDRTRNNPIPISDQWPADHPVLEALVDRETAGGFLLKATFKDRIGFVDSTRSPAVRLADVIASAVRRGMERRVPDAVIRALRVRTLGPFPMAQLVWSDQPPRPRPNPYLGLD